MNKVRKTLGSLFRVQETQDATEATTPEATTEETTESADETTETAESEEEESPSEASTDETTTPEATVADSVTMSLAAYNALKATADSATALSKQLAVATEKAKKWDAHQASVQGIKPLGDLNSTTEADANETAGDAETKRLKARYPKLID